jgi:hypothetical protein
MSQDAPYCVVLDANVWVAERLLQSSIGSAVLYAIAGANALIGLPEVVEIEVNGVLRNMAEKAVAGIGRDSSLLRQLSGQQLKYVAPTTLAIREGIEHRWKQLDGVLIRIPFTHDQAKSGLNRVINKSPPSGENNEQFRDCCIWEAALSLAAERSVHLITNDSAFYEGRNRLLGLATSLRQELTAVGSDLHIYPGLREFLSAMDKTASPIDEKCIGAAIVLAVTPRAREIAAEKDRFELGKAHPPLISGYATPKPSLVAVSFEVSFELKRIESKTDEEERSDATLAVKGVCSYDPNLKQVSDIEIREWRKSLTGYEGRGWSGSGWTDPISLEREYSPSRIRFIP